MNLPTFSDRLLGWFDHHGRKNLPWQQGITPYHVWLSEIMLQQTQVNTVIDYYTRFISHYADVAALASANLDDILALWTGLGYYARARNLHKTAQIIVEQHQGIIPASLDDLIALPGIGRSTAGAIMALGYRQSHPILDGNVKRVLTRYAAISGWPGQKVIEQQLWQLAEQLLPKERIEHYIQAQMDLGATICTRSKPLCSLCPLTADCKGYQSGVPSQFPTPKPKKAVPLRQIHWIVILSQSGLILLEQRPNSGIWGGLWSFPEFKDLTTLSLFYRQNFGGNREDILPQKPIRHIFTHYKLDIFPYLVHSSACSQSTTDFEGLGWHTKHDALRLGLPAPVKAFLKLLE
ncbi:MAG: A/G-specific adenine glycosylase [Methylophagaceae bacterium]